MRILKKLLIISTCLIVLTACGSKKGNENKEQTTKSNEEIINLIKEANTKEALLKNTDCLKIEYTNLSDGKMVDSLTEYLYDDFYIIDNLDGEIYFEDDKFEYHYIEDENNLLVLLIVADNEDESNSYFINFDVFDEDTLTGRNSVEYKNGKIIFTSTFDKGEVFNDAQESYGEDYDINCLKFVLECDDKDYVIKGATQYLVTDSEEVLIDEAKFIFDAEKKTLPNDVLDIVNNTNTSKLTIIAGAGTDKEKTFEFDIPTGAGTEVYTGLPYEQGFYLDEECKEPYDGVKGLEGGLTLYVKTK